MGGAEGIQSAANAASRSSCRLVYLLRTCRIQFEASMPKKCAMTVLTHACTPKMSKATGGGATRW